MFLLTAFYDYIRKWYCVSASLSTLSSLSFNSSLSFSLFDSFYPDITIFLVILQQYHHIGSFDITIPRYNDIILQLTLHIVISGFHCTRKLMGQPDRMLGRNLRWTSILFRGSRSIPSNFTLQKLEFKHCQLLAWVGPKRFYFTTLKELRHH